MSQIRLYLDEDVIKRALVEALRSSGLDVITTSDINRLGTLDEEQLIWATEQERVIYSFNVGDFCRLHQIFMAQGREHTGIIVSQQQRYSVGEQLQGFLKLSTMKSAEEMRNQLVFISGYIGVN